MIYEVVQAMTEVVCTYTCSIYGVGARNAQNKTNGKGKKNYTCETALWDSQMCRNV